MFFLCGKRRQTCSSEDASALLGGAADQKRPGPTVRTRFLSSYFPSHLFKWTFLLGPVLGPRCVRVPAPACVFLLAAAAPRRASPECDAQRNSAVMPDYTHASCEFRVHRGNVGCNYRNYIRQAALAGGVWGGVGGLGGLGGGVNINDQTRLESKSTIKAKFNLVFVF